LGAMRKRPTLQRLVRPARIVLFASLLLTSCFATAHAGKSGGFLWKSVDRAQIKLDEKTPLAWNIYQTTQKKEANLVLILLGRRFIALDLKARVAYAVPASDLRPNGADFDSGDLFVESRVLPTDGWSLRDVGPAELIKLKLNDYGTALQIELPHPPDLRGLY
jgi:hypothetical protein